MPKDTKKKKVKGGMDAELEALLGQLSTLQVRVGGGSAGTTEASRAALARGGVGADPFLDLKEAMLAQLSDVRSKVREHQAKPAKTPRDQISREAEVKKALRKLRHDWHDLDTMIQAELRRKKPRYEKDELQMREEVVLRLMREIDAARTMSKQARNEVKDIETGHSRTIVKRRTTSYFKNARMMMLCATSREKPSPITSSSGCSSSRKGIGSSTIRSRASDGASRSSGC